MRIIKQNCFLFSFKKITIVCICLHARVYLRACLCVCMRVCACARVYACVCHEGPCHLHVVDKNTHSHVT